MFRTAFRKIILFVCAAFTITLFSGCSTNPATGDKQFTALMSPSQETQVGAQEHENVIQTFGLLPANDPVQKYVERVGQKVAQNTERSDVQYRFFVVDDPMVNAFALPGGYVYVSRGLLAQANTEAELAAVLAHEVGHITARHSAARYSQGVLTSLGASLIGIAMDNPQAAQLASVGSDLFIKTYSRGQELEADELGIRYLGKAGYSPYAMANFLRSLSESDALERQMAGQHDSGFDFFSTHPRTEDRFQKASALAEAYPNATPDNTSRDEYFRTIDGMVYGDSARHGFARGTNFYQPDMGFTFSVPVGFDIHNQPTQVIATSPNTEAVIVFDADSNKNGLDPLAYLQQVWLKGEPVGDAERTTISGKDAATASFAGQVNGKPMIVRLVTVAWAPDLFYRFLIGIPKNTPEPLVEELKRTTYSLRPMSDQEKNEVGPYTLDVVIAKPGDTVASLAAQLPYAQFKEERFRVLNGLTFEEKIVPGQSYKIVKE
jgi:predicted Zn-dependent protease